MKKIIASIIIFILLITSVLSVNATDFSIISDIIYVDDDNTIGPWDGTQQHPYKYVQDGINASNDNDTVFVYNGYYNENIIINRSIVLIGENNSNTKIETIGYESIEINAEYVTIAKFNLTAGNRTRCISGNITIIDNIIWIGSEYQLYLDHSSNNKIIRNIFNSRFYSLYLHYSDNNIISDNYFKGAFGFSSIKSMGSNNNIFTDNIWENTNLEAICLLGSSNNTISENSILYAKHSDQAIFVIGGGFNHILKNNISNTPIGINLESSNDIVRDNIITNITMAGIRNQGAYNSLIGNKISNLQGGLMANGIVIEGSNNLVMENTIENITGTFPNGILIWLVTISDNIIKENTIKNITGSPMAGGISIQGGINSTISNNTITNIFSGNSNGLFLDDASNNTILDNTMACNMNYSDDQSCNGIYMYNSQSNNITRNIIVNNRVGIFSECNPSFGETKDNVFSENILAENEFGILLWSFSKYNIVSKNNIKDNYVGIKIGFLCKGNVVFKNNIAENYASGVYLERAFSNMIVANDITNITNYGVYADKNSFNNKIYYNNFVNNGKGRNAYDAGINIWYKFKFLGNSKGNYWDDYTGVDDKWPKGVGDTPYIIKGRKILLRKDRCPAIDLFDINDIDIGVFVKNKLEDNIQLNMNSILQKSNTPSNPYITNKLAK